MQKKNFGFTLLEMAMVLVIIGLIAGGVLVGSDLIRTSQLNAVSIEFARYTQAFIDFRDKYHALPGDFNGAEALWGTDLGGCPNPTTGLPATPYTATAHTTTCNGNGDGQIGGPGGFGGVHDYEVFRAWQHLSNAGFIDGAYSGISGTNNPYNPLPGINVPASRLTGSLYLETAWGVVPPGSAFYWPAFHPHIIDFAGAAMNGAGGSTSVPNLAPLEAMALDSKLDDGYPATGNVSTTKPPASSCATNNNDPPYNSANPAPLYDANNKKNACILIFTAPF